MESKTGAINEFEQIAARLRNHFDKRVELYGGGIKAVDWKSTLAQHNRFAQLVKLIDLSRFFSINDYGCGDGALCEYLTAQNYQFEYFGFDVSPRMVERAKETYDDYSNCRFSSDRALLETADYTVASGIFNLKLEASNTEWKNYMLEKVHEINNLSNRGFAFNALTSYSDLEFQRADLYYADPLFWFDYCKRNISKYVGLLHDYPEYDFTIIVRKD